VAAVGAWAPTARAVEHEHALGLDLGGALVIVHDKPAADIGPAFGAHWTYGLSDAFNLMVEGAWSLASPSDKPGPKTPATLPGWVGNADVGAAYVFDVIQWVPYAGLLAGATVLSGGSLEHPKVAPDLSLALGMDYRLQRQLTIGVGLRQHMLLLDTSAYPSFTQAFARVEYVWGW
jgi:hypothetical protein